MIIFFKFTLLFLLPVLLVTYGNNEVRKRID